MATLIFSLMLIAVVCCVCFCEEREKPDLSDEKHKLSADQTDGSEELPITAITELDKEIQEEIKKPTALEDSFEVQLKVLKLLVKFYNYMKDLYDGALKNSPSKLNVAQKLIENSGPDFIKEEIDDQKLQQVYNWDGGNLEFFRDYVQDIKEVWNNITLVIKDKPIATNLHR